MSHPIRFHFDPNCPWTYQTSRWVRQLERLDEVEVEWRLFSLAFENAGDEEDEQLEELHLASTLALRTIVAARREGGNVAAGALYEALGRRLHEHGEPADERATIIGALGDASLDPQLVERAAEDTSTWHEVIEDHRLVTDRSRSIASPTIVLDGGSGPAVFGPVLTELPDDDNAVELWHHVTWLTRFAPFAELKRERHDLDLVSYQRFQEEEAAEDAA